MKILLIAIVCIFAMLSTPGLAQLKGNVPLVRLLATPKVYNGNAVSVSGVLHRADGCVLALYIDPSSAESGVTANAIVLMLAGQETGMTEEQIHQAIGKYVLVAATFDIDPPQPRGYSGILKAIEALRPYPLLQPLDQRDDQSDQSH